MLAYRLRHRVQIEKPIRAQNLQTGEITTEWVDAQTTEGKSLGNMPAEVLTGAGKESSESATTMPNLPARINLRWFPADVIEMHEWRIIWNGLVYNISSVETDITGKREWRIRCYAGLNEGD